MSAPTMTRDLAWSAAQDAANSRMRAAGRSKWNQDDYRLAIATFDRLWPEERDYETKYGPAVSGRLSTRESNFLVRANADSDQRLPCIDLSNLGQVLGLAEMDRICARCPIVACFLFTREARAAVIR